MLTVAFILAGFGLLFAGLGVFFFGAAALRKAFWNWR